LAADESTGTIGKRLSQIKLENNETNRRNYRELLFTTHGDWQNFISGVILYEETLFQKSSDGTPFVDMLKKKGVIAGIKVDKGLVPFPGTDGKENATQGLDDLGKRCSEYYKQGARFAKWRNALQITDTLPSQLCIRDTAHTLARYAAICQENGLVPIVEPEVLMDGKHSLARCEEVTRQVLAAVFEALNVHHVMMDGMLLKPNMVTPGHESEEYKTTTPQQIGEATVRALQATVPPSVPGIMFLSGGQEEEEASVNLNAINTHPGKKPWSLTFSYGRALQHSAIDQWSGKTENIRKGQDAFFKRAKANSEASVGKYRSEGKSSSANNAIYEQGYKY